MQLFSMLGHGVSLGRRAAVRGAGWSRRLIARARKRGRLFTLFAIAVLPHRPRAVRHRPARRIRRPHLPGGARAAALRDPRRSWSASREPMTRTRARSSSRTTTSACAACSVLLDARRRRAAGRDAPRRPGRGDLVRRVAALAAEPDCRCITPIDANDRRDRRRGAGAPRPISCSRSTTGRCCRARCSPCRRAAPSTCTARCCRATAAARRSTGPCCTARRETGVTLHLDGRSSPTPATSSTSSAVPILRDDTALEVFDKVDGWRPRSCWRGSLPG